MELEEEPTVQTATSHGKLPLTPSEDTGKIQDVVMDISEKTRPKIV